MKEWPENPYWATQPSAIASNSTSDWRQQWLAPPTPVTSATNLSQGSRPSRLTPRSTTNLWSPAVSPVCRPTLRISNTDLSRTSSYSMTSHCRRCSTETLIWWTFSPLRSLRELYPRPLKRIYQDLRLRISDCWIVTYLLMTLANIYICTFKYKNYTYVICVMCSIYHRDICQIFHKT